MVDGVIDVIASDSAPTKLMLEPDKINRLWVRISPGSKWLKY